MRILATNTQVGIKTSDVSGSFIPEKTGADWIGSLQNTSTVNGNFAETSVLFDRVKPDTEEGRPQLVPVLGLFLCRDNSQGTRCQIAWTVALLKDGRFTNYETALIFAETDDDAVEKAKSWAHSFENAPEDAWLQVAMSGKGICSLRPGEFGL